MRPLLKPEWMDSPEDHRSAKSLVKQGVSFCNYPDDTVQALIRDNYRCVLTGKMDAQSYLRFPHLRVEGVRGAITQCAHIFPESLGKKISTNEAKVSDLNNPPSIGYSYSHLIA